MFSDQLTNRRAVVCGSTQGIGRAVAEQLAARGARLTLIARNEAALREVATSLPAPADQQHDYLVADFAHPEELATVLAPYTKTQPPVHILVNNTGGPAGGPLLAAPAEALRAAFEQHVICSHLLAQALVPGMKAAGYGRIVNVISTSVKQPLPNLGVSNTIRGAVANWAKTLANELGPYGITVNNVLPGATLTQRHSSLLQARSASSGEPVEALEAQMLKLIPAGRFGEAAEVAAAVAFLVSPLAAYINGTNVPVDGGRTSSL